MLVSILFFFIVVIWVKLIVDTWNFHGHLVIDTYISALKMWWNCRNNLAFSRLRHERFILYSRKITTIIFHLNLSNRRTVFWVSFAMIYRFIHKYIYYTRTISIIPTYNITPVVPSKSAYVKIIMLSHLSLINSTS